MITTDKYNKNNKLIVKLFAICVGLLAGAVNGFLGTGGGIILVPCMILLFGMEQKKAQATAMIIVLPLCILSGIIYTLNGIADWRSLLYVGIGVIAGGIIGANLLKKLSNNFSSILFYALMLAGGIKMLIK